MNKVINNKIIYTLLAAACAYCMLLMMLFVTGNFDRANAARGDFSVEIVPDTSSVYDYNGEWFLSSNSDRTVVMKYIVTNNTSEDKKFSALKITENLYGMSQEYGSTVYDEGIIVIPAGESIEITGALLTFDNSEEFILQYDVQGIYYVDPPEETPTPEITPTPDIELTPTPDIELTPTPDVEITPTPEIPQEPSVSPTPDVVLPPEDGGEDNEELQMFSLRSAEMYSDEYESLLSETGIIYIVQDRIDFEVQYVYHTATEEIYVNTSLPLEITVTSFSNVPLYNIQLYDSEYGYLGTIDELLPEQYQSVTKRVTVTQSTVSYPYLTYDATDGSEEQIEIEFLEQSLPIDVVELNYELTFEVSCDSEYISLNGQAVDVKFVLTNVGSAALENIVVYDSNRNIIFRVESIIEGEVYEKVQKITLKPDTLYTYTCETTQTLPVFAELSFASMPKVELSYEFDKDINSYSYMDTVTVIYTIKNTGSLDAQKLVFTDYSQNKTWNIGVLKVGAQRTITYTVTITSARTSFTPSLEGEYVDYDGLINETLESTHIVVVMPTSHCDISIAFSFEPNVVYVGDNAVLILDVMNIGDGALKSYTLLIVEKGMVIASEGKLVAGGTAQFTTSLRSIRNEELTVRISGKNEETNEAYTKDFILSINAEIPIAPTATPTPSAGATAPVNTPKPTADPNSGNGENEGSMIYDIVNAAILFILVLLVLVVLSIIIAFIRVKLVKRRR